MDGDNFLTVWQSNLQDGSGYGIYGQIGMLNANVTTIIPNNTIPDQFAYMLLPFSYTFQPNLFNETLNRTLNFSLETRNSAVAPFWISVDSSTNTISGTPANDSSLNYDFVLYAYKKQNNTKKSGRMQ